MFEKRGKTRQVIEKIGGASRDRTDDLIVANDALSQLSYSPTCGRVKAEKFRLCNSSSRAAGLAPSVVTWKWANRI